jgi:hypothetical protein
MGGSQEELQRAEGQMRQRHYAYRNYHEETPPQPPSNETKEARLKRILRDMPASICHNRELLFKALKKSAQTQ